MNLFKLPACRYFNFFKTTLNMVYAVVSSVPNEILAGQNKPNYEVNLTMLGTFEVVSVAKTLLLKW